MGDPVSNNARMLIPLMRTMTKGSWVTGILAGALLMWWDLESGMEWDMPELGIWGD
jgi:hypothetical protein